MLALLLALSLSGRGGSSPSPPILAIPINQLTAPSQNSPWRVTHSSAPVMVGVANGVSYFDFLACSDPTTCWISYVERPWTIPLTGKTSVSLSYSIAGNAPVFDYRTSTNNTCLGAASLSLLLHQAGDNLSGQGAYAFYRWFSWQEAQPLALGDHTLTVPLTVDKWVSVYRSTPEAIAAGFASALANMESIGFGLGGGCFAAHGVTVTSGSARFVITGFSVQ